MGGISKHEKRIALVREFVKRYFTYYFGLTTEGSWGKSLRVLDFRHSKRPTKTPT